MTDTRQTKINAVHYTPRAGRLATVLESPGFTAKMTDARAVLAGIRREREDEMIENERREEPTPGKPRVTRWVIGGVVAVLLAGLGIGVAVAATGDDSGTPSGAVQTSPGGTDTPTRIPTPPHEPRTLEAARVAAQRGWDRFTANDYAGTYDTYGREISSRIGRADYAALFKACNEAQGAENRLAVTAEDPRWANDEKTEVTLTIRHPLVTATRTMVYEDNRWVQRPEPETLEVIATFKASGRDAAIKKHCQV